MADQANEFAFVYPEIDVTEDGRRSAAARVRKGLSQSFNRDDGAV
jgi:hypothetical protein